MRRTLEYGLGLIKDPDDVHDWLMRTFLKDPRALPKEFSNRDKQTAVNNQGAEGACAGFAGIGDKEYEERIDRDKFIKLSERFLYEFAKEDSGHSEGTTLRSICAVLKKYGVPEEHFWPYIPQKPNRPSDLNPALKNALQYRIKGYARILKLEELKGAIFQGYPKGGTVMTGMRLYKSILSKKAKESGVCPNPTCWDRGKSIGGHAMLATGWTDNSPHYKKDGHIEKKGSWGTGYGDDGYHYFSYKNIKKNMLDAYSTVDITGYNKPIERVYGLIRYERDTSWGV